MVGSLWIGAHVATTVLPLNVLVHALPVRLSATLAAPWKAAPNSKLIPKCRPLRGNILPNPNRIDGATFLSKLRLAVPFIGLVGSEKYDAPPKLKLAPGEEDAVAVTGLPKNATIPGLT